MRFLYYHSQMVITDDQDKEMEMEQLKLVLQENNCRSWMFDIPHRVTQKSTDKVEHGGSKYSVPLP